MSPEGRPPPPVTPVTPPPRSAVVVARPLGWRNPWTRLLGALAAFQAGVIVTLLWTSGRTGEGARTDERVATVTLPGGGTAPTPLDAATSSTPPVDAGPSSAVLAPPDAAAPPPTERPRPHAPPRRPALPVEPPPVETPPSSMTPAAAMVEVEIVSEPEGATVRIGGAVWGVTPLTALLPGSDRVVVHLELAGHEPARVTWSPASGRRSLRATLAPLESP